MRVLVLSDTHAPMRWKGVPPALERSLAEADAILHAGDVCTVDVLDELARFAPVHVALGNNDPAAVLRWGAEPVLAVELGGLRVGMIHDAGPREGRGRRMRRLFGGVDLVVHGHTHVPSDTVEDGVRLLNPGSVSDPRSQPQGSYTVLEVADGQVAWAWRIPVPRLTRPR